MPCKIVHWTHQRQHVGAPGQQSKHNQLVIDNKDPEQSQALLKNGDQRPERPVETVVSRGTGEAQLPKFQERR